MSVGPDSYARNIVASDHALDDASLIARLRRVRRELRAMLAAAAHGPHGERHDAVLQLLQVEINALGREFLRLSEILLARGNAGAKRGDG